MRHAGLLTRRQSHRAVLPYVVEEMQSARQWRIRVLQREAQTQQGGVSLVAETACGGRAGLAHALTVT